MIYQYCEENKETILAALQDEDTVEISGADFRKLLGTGTTSKGRKPIEIDADLFNETVKRWRSGEISARQAMQILQLKPNTFYRRIKERCETDMTDIKSEIKEVKAKLHDDAEKALQAVEDKKQILDVEREIRHEKISAKLEHVDEVINMKRAVSREREEYKEKQ